MDKVDAEERYLEMDDSTFEKAHFAKDLVRAAAWHQILKCKPWDYITMMVDDC